MHYNTLVFNFHALWQNQDFFSGSRGESYDFYLKTLSLYPFPHTHLLHKTSYIDDYSVKLNIRKMFFFPSVVDRVQNDDVQNKRNSVWLCIDDRINLWKKKKNKIKTSFWPLKTSLVQTESNGGLNGEKCSFRNTRRRQQRDDDDDDDVGKITRLKFTTSDNGLRSAAAVWLGRVPVASRDRGKVDSFRANCQNVIANVTVSQH